MQVLVKKVWIYEEDEVLERDLVLALEARKIWEVVDDPESADAYLTVRSGIGVSRSPSAYVIHEGHVGDNTSVVTVDEVGGGINVSASLQVEARLQNPSVTVFSSCLVAGSRDCEYLPSSLNAHLEVIQKVWEKARSKVR